MTVSKKPVVTLALQGGGAHGAFTWGVLDRLLEEGIGIEGISGTSSGAMNAATLACGMLQGGNEHARAQLESFWRKVSQKSHNIPTYHSVQPRSSNPLSSPLHLLKSLFFQMLSPYFLNPFNINPLKDILEEIVDFSLLHREDALKLYICATNVETNRVKIFENKELCKEALLASACLSMLAQAVKWKGEHYWDGGFMGNPMLEPLIYNCTSRDLIIVQAVTMRRPEVPMTPDQILNRIQEITFNSSFMGEIRNIVNIQKLSEKNFCDQENPYANLRLHCIQNEPLMADLPPSSKENTRWDFLVRLRDEGRKTADQWLQENLGTVGVASTMDLEAWRNQTPSTTCATLKWTR